ncbi:ABC transporter substrate-binding protein [Paenibacillus albidus]|uniref:ABC transporter substrate-binding protein n=1 Tax=Paenibacillus albidus TaxID=2041023 RepID=A0A917C5D0_9BACL|nr:extracellular solute-binding protein [Paenibacillus albidus]GGF71659.1 ABC transporter substrate-binding protein [Paenibacillus albidus]
MKKAKKPILLGLALGMAGTLLAGCGGGNNAAATTNGNANAGNSDTAPITFKFFDKNFDQPFTNPVAQEITKKTGVTIEMVPTTGNAEEKLNLMLASNDFPDIVLISRTDDLINKYIAAEALIPLDDLIEKYGPNIKKMYGDTINKSRSADGKTYYLNNWYSLEKEPVAGIQMRKDLLIELGEAERANNPAAPFTSEEYYTLLKKFKEKYPTIDGKASLGATWDYSNYISLLSTFKGMFGMKTYYDDQGTLKQDVRDPQYKAMLAYMNKLYREGLVDPEFVVNKKETWKQKVSNGNVFSTEGSYWELDTPNSILRKNSDGTDQEDRQLFAYKVVAPGVDADKTTYGGRSSLGWDAIGITKSNPDPVRTIKFFDYLASEEGQYLLMWGVEGKDWELKDGKHTPIGDIVEKFQSEWDKTVEATGIRRYTWFINNGSGSDGTPFDMASKYRRDVRNLHASEALADSVWDTSEYENLGPDAGTPEALIAQKYEDIKKSAIAKIIMAKTESEALSLYDNMIQEMDAIGMAKLETIVNEKYKARMELWK